MTARSPTLTLRNEQTGETREVTVVRRSAAGTIVIIHWPGLGEYRVRSERVYVGKRATPWVVEETL